ncbi:hypothetical protein FDW83_09020 [Pseudarthrobacter sp. NamE2]|uniref:C-glycoside deglycosidase beta subunit domain-containing protein n=1 Tax=Pseudarthrobacter sp. NamE2 TaxID=2576838 RepID=UPI0010FD45A8|nr:DUF6379 domain-containing protein [Pseudarthrobacter sp. NamE2]TLM83595.1 hypothetical protein FDW83_09020 [Pseudarthrobacter sp. NamE2]
MTFQGYMVQADSATTDGSTLRYIVRLPWYRSLPLSAVVVLAVEIDGREISGDLIRLEVNGGSYRIEDLAERWDDIWFVQDEATVAITDSTAAALHHAEITTVIDLRSPYILIGPERPLVTNTRSRQVFEIAQKVPTS